MSRAMLHCGDVREVLATLPAESVQCVVTSPPYWGLRAYGTAAQTWGGDVDCVHDWQHARYYVEGGGGAGSSAEAFSEPGEANAERIKKARWREDDTCHKCGAWRGELGLEPTPALYVEHMVAVFRAVRRVLRDDGVLWLNLGDSYAGSWGAQSREHAGKRAPNISVISANQVKAAQIRESGTGSMSRTPGLKPKDLVGLPWRVALALQADGWWLRSDIIWAKPNPMPESVTDRPTRSHEYLFLLTRGERYYYDAAAIRTPWTSGRDDMRLKGVRTGTAYLQQGPIASNNKKPDKQRGHGRRHAGFNDRWDAMERSEQQVNGANARSVWTIATQPYREAHFATFPEELARRCILVGSSARACEHCGAPWERVTKRDGKGPTFNPLAIAESGALPDGPGTHRNMGGSLPKVARRKPQADHGDGNRPASARTPAPVAPVVLDPFAGSGTVAQVATGNGRDSIYIDLNPAYLDLARQRIGPMLCDDPELVA